MLTILKADVYHVISASLILFLAVFKAYTCNFERIKSKQRSRR